MATLERPPDVLEEEVVGHFFRPECVEILRYCEEKKISEPLGNRGKNEI
jgi:hypothetical protein